MTEPGPDLVQLAAASTRTVRGSLLKPDAIPALASRHGHRWAALADRTLVAAIPAFLAACRSHGIPPVIGLWHGPRLVLATSDPGLRALGVLSTAVACQPDPPAAPDELHHDGLFTIACTPDAVPHPTTRAVGVTRAEPGPGHHERRLRDAAHRASLPAVGLVPWHAASADHRPAAAVLHASAAGTTIEHARGEIPPVIHPLPGDQLQAVFADTPELLANAAAVARRCTAGSRAAAADAPFTRAGTRPGAEQAKLADDARAALDARFPDGVPDAYAAQLETELDIIEKTGFASLFLTVADVLRDARERGVQTGPGRGSAAGSLVSWLLGITVPDPLEHGLQFTRFLNPDRVSPPDFDVDIEPERQRDVQQAIQAYWNGDGPERSAPIAAWNTFQAPAAFRVSCTARGIPHPVVNRALDHLHATDARFAQGPDDLRAAAGAAATPFPNIREADRPRLLAALEDVPVLIGATNALSRHPGAIALLQEPLDGTLARFVPDPEHPSERTIQLDHDETEQAGAVKVDVLSLAALTLIRDLQRHVPDRDPWNLPEDEDVYRHLSQGNTTGVFQLEGFGITRVLRDLAPANFHELRALVALFRPGSIAYLDSFIARARGREPARPPHPALEDALRETHGIVVYQEQAMQAAVTLAGFTQPQADLMRRAIGKKLPQQMAELKSLFLGGVRAHTPTLDAAGAEAVWSILEAHSGYAFNKAHATAYSLITYALAWYKVHHPEPFYAALAAASLHRAGTDRRLLLAAAAAARHGVPIECPDASVEPANPGFHVVPGAGGANRIVPPPHILKSVGPAATQAVADIARGGAPDSAQAWVDALLRTSLPRAQVETLLAHGFFRAYPDRPSLDPELLADESPAPAADPPPWARIPAFPRHDALVYTIRANVQMLDADTWPDDAAEADCLALVIESQERQGRNGTYRTATLGDDQTLLEAVCAPHVAELLADGGPLPDPAVVTLVRTRGRPRIVALVPLPEAQRTWPGALLIHFDDARADPDLGLLKDALQPFVPGSLRTVLGISDETDHRFWDLGLRVANDPGIVDAVAAGWPAASLRVYPRT